MHDVAEKPRDATYRLEILTHSIDESNEKSIDQTDALSLSEVQTAL